MTNAPASARDRSSNAKGSGPSWKLGIGAGGAAVAIGAAAYNAFRAKRAEEDNPPLGSFLDADGVRLHYLEKGSGPLIVLLHGNATMIEDWLVSGVFDALAKTNRVIAFDRPGFGHSARPRTTIWTPAAQARLIAAALTGKGETEATVVGHSFGTLVAAELGLSHRKFVRSLVLIGGYYYPSVRADAVIASPPAVPVLGDAIRYTVSPLLGAAMRPGMEKQIFSPAPVSAGWKERFPFAMTLRPSQLRASAAEAALMVPASLNLAERLGSSSLPITLLAGEGDKVVSTADHSGRLADAVSRSESVIVEGAGHMVHHTASKRVANAIAVASR